MIVTSFSVIFDQTSHTHTHIQTGQFFRDGVSLDNIRKLLILPGKEPVPIQRKPLWAFMERERGDLTNFCWVAMNPGYQGEGLIDGSYFDYLVDDVLSTEFKYKKLWTLLQIQQQTQT